MDLKKGLGPNIKALRKMARLTQAELAAKVGLERTSITNIENGRQTLNPRTLVLIADALGYRVRVHFEKK